MEKIKNFNKFINKETLNENTFEIDDKMLMEMATIGYIGKFKIIVWSNEGGNIPHFHIVDISTLGQSFHTCVKIESPEYFHHEEKTDTLNSKQRKSLVDFLNKPFDEDTSNWEYLIMTWNINCSGKRLSKKMSIPDYTKLK
jgi:hypothetical protein